MGIFGVGVLLINGFFLYRRHIPNREFAFWFLLVGYSVGSAVLSAIGRAGLFVTSVPNQPLETRYVLHTFPFWLAVIFLTLKVLDCITPDNLHCSHRRLRRFNRFALGGLLTLYMLVDVPQIIYIQPLIAPSKVACARAYPQTQDVLCLKGIYPDDDLNALRPALDGLYEYRLSVYDDVPR